MAAIYAGVLGPLATTVVLLRSVKDGGAAEPTMVASVVGLIVFAAIGYLVGGLAHRTIEESVARRFQEKLGRFDTDSARAIRTGDYAERTADAS